MRRLAHEFQFRLQHADAPFRFIFGQLGPERFRLISIMSQFSKQAGLLGRHAGNCVRLLAHGHIIAAAAARSTEPYACCSAGRRIRVIGKVTSTIAATTISALETPTASPSKP